jgi:CheY-like chemotaxis protein/anti-sigma regulatory factor (Ser/Thr protein kinase)
VTKILVVDDSAVDRRLVGGILQRTTNWNVEYAQHGGEALQKLPIVKPDLILTDLQMPEMDGLELVARIRSQGSEELAIQALKAGASSYTPKRLLSSELVETVRHVLSVAGKNRQRHRLMSRIVSAQINWTLENDAALIAPLVDQMQSFVPEWDESDRLRMGVALDEALVNAMYHGNLEVGSELREEDDSAYYSLIRDRSHQSPYQERRVHVNVHFSSTQIDITIRDEGPGFNPSNLRDPTEPENIERVSGRGLLLIRTFMDEVIHNDRGNQISMIKRRTAESASSSA